MKKTLVLASLLAAFGAASAQSSVTLYGKADVQFGTVKTTSVTNSSGDSVATTNSGMQNGPDGSRWGVRGSEALGGGLNANFVLESGLNVPDGSGFGGATAGAATATSQPIFARRATVGVSGGFGSVDLGRHLVPTIFVAGGTDVDGINALATTSHATGNAANLAGAYFRRSNAITFTSANYGGVRVMAQYAGDKTKVGSAAATADNLFGDNGVGASVTYAAGPIYVGAAMDTAKVIGGVKSASNVVGASYNLGFVKLMANFGSTKTTSGANNVKFDQVNFGVSAPMGALTLLAGVGTNKLSLNGAAAGKGTDTLVGLNYALSPRTSLQFRAGVVDKMNNGVIAPSAAVLGTLNDVGGFVPGKPAVAGYTLSGKSSKKDAVLFGLVHNF
jgi:predicted porin